MRLPLPVIAGLLVTVALTSACDRAAQPAATPAEPAVSPAPATNTGIALDPEGIRLINAETGSTTLLSFGSPAEQAHTAIAATRADQAAEQGTNSECPPGAMDYSQWNDLTLWFQNGQFVGWAVDEPGPNTLTGIGVGATRVQLERDYTIEWVPDSTLGTEFMAGDMSGIIGDDGTITNLWAGMSCNFR